MSATEEWLRYIENRAIMQTYGVKGYQYEEHDDSDDLTDNSNILTKESTMF